MPACKLRPILPGGARGTLVFLCLIGSLRLHGAEAAPSVAGSNTNALASNLRLFTDRTPLGTRIERGILQVGHDQFSFVTPENFRCDFDPKTSKAQFVSSEPPAIVTIGVQGPHQDSGVSTNAVKLREMVLSRYDRATVMDEFEVSVENWRGRAIEIEWPMGTKRVTIRIASINVSSGTLVFTVRASAEHIRACDQPFHHLLLSIRTGLNGAKPAFQQRLSEL